MRLDLKVLMQQEKVLDLYHGEMILEVNFTGLRQMMKEIQKIMLHIEISFILYQIHLKVKKRNYKRLNLDLEI